MHYGVLPTVGMRGYGTECAKRLRAFVGEGSAEAFDIGIDGLSERASRDSDIQCVSVSEETPLLGQSFLGERLLCGYGWAEQRNDPEIRAVPGERRTASGTTNAGARSSAFSEGAISTHPFGVQRAKPRSKNVVHLLATHQSGLRTTRRGRFIGLLAGTRRSTDVRGKKARQCRSRRPLS